MCEPSQCPGCGFGEVAYCEGDTCACKCESDACGAVDCKEPTSVGECFESCECVCEDALCAQFCEEGGDAGYECDGAQCRCCADSTDFVNEDACIAGCEAQCGECDSTCFGSLCVCGDT